MYKLCRSRWHLEEEYKKPKYREIADALNSLIDSEIAEAVAEQKGTCEWTYDDNHDYYDTKCGEAYSLIDGTLEENKHKLKLI